MTGTTSTTATAYQDVRLYIDGAWVETGQWADIENPATGQVIGRMAKAGAAEIAHALRAAETGFETWRKISAFERSNMLRKAAQILRDRLEAVSRIMVMEQGKPLSEARAEIAGACDTMDWFAEEARRAYGRIVPARAPGVLQMVLREPVGPVAAFSPWNFPVNQAMRKISAALAAGCSIILKGPEDTPGSPAALIQALHEAGIPRGVVNLVYGVPSEISSTLIAHKLIRKISFTGSTSVGKQLASLAGLHMKRMTMELGGHAPAIICEDADLDLAVKLVSFAKFRNAGQVCTAPTRILVQKPVFDAVLEKFIAAAQARKLGNGLDDDTSLGPLAHNRRVDAIEAMMADARKHGVKVHLGGERVDGAGHFFAPTVLTGLTNQMQLMNEEPFGPIAMLIPFDTVEDAIVESKRLDYGLASYAFTRSLRFATLLSEGVDAGMLTINHNGLALPEVPFGGIKDSGYGTEGGADALENYMISKFVSQAGLA